MHDDLDHSQTQRDSHPALDLGQTLRGLRPGQRVFNRYTLTHTLGRGGLSSVWLARDEELEHPVALKFLPELVLADKGAFDDLRKEVQRAHQLTHPHIVSIHDFLRDDTTAAIVMEYVPGPTLAQLRLEQADQVFTLEQLKPWVEQLCSALDYAHHEERVMHRDLRPAHLMLDTHGALKVLDFGLARSLRDSVSRVSQLAVSGDADHYLSPQQLMGEDPTPSDDLYSLGATLYELLSGQPPFATGNLHVQVLNNPALLLNERRRLAGLPPVPAVWEHTLAACLAKDPSARPPSAGAVEEALTGRPRRGAEPPPLPFHSAAEPVPPPLPLPAPFAPPAPQDPSAPADSAAKPAAFVIILRPTWIAAAVLAASVALAGGGYYAGIYAPAKRRLAEQARVQAAQARATAEAQEQARLAALAAEARQAEEARIQAEKERADDLAKEKARFAALKAEQVAAAQEAARIKALAEQREQDSREAARLEKLAAIQRAQEEETRRITQAQARVAKQGKPQVGQPYTLPDLYLELLPIAAGSFTMGSNHGSPDELPLTEVRLTQPFWLGKYEVTWDEWATLTGGTAPATNWKRVPIAGIDYYEALDFCDKLTERERLAGRLPEGYAYTLPTEAQWEYACRAGTTGDSAGVLSEIAWYKLNFTGFEQPVGQKRANAWGLHDMLGSVVEWCLDAYVDKLPGGTVTDPFYMAGAERVQRGGHELSSADECRFSARNHSLPDSSHNRRGFRIALSVVPPTSQQPQEGQIFTIPGLNLKLMPIAAGAFWTGKGRSDHTSRELKIRRPFWLGKHEVTQEEWEAVMGNNPAHFKGGRRPVEKVSYDEAHAFGVKLTERERAAGRLPEGYVYALPSEAQWEYASSTGSNYDNTDRLDTFGWYEKNSGGKIVQTGSYTLVGSGNNSAVKKVPSGLRTAGETHPVGRKQSNRWGLNDMQGNVWEWCGDWYRDGTEVNMNGLLGANRAQARILRGGGWKSDASDCTFYNRVVKTTGSRFNDLGFRIALRVVPEPDPR